MAGRRRHPLEQAAATLIARLHRRSDDLKRVADTGPRALAAPVPPEVQHRCLPKCKKARFTASHRVRHRLRAQDGERLLQQSTTHFASA